MKDDKRFTIGVLVKALTRGQAEDVADIRMADHILPAYGRGTSSRPWTTESGEKAQALAQELWADYIGDVTSAIEQVAKAYGDSAWGYPESLLSNVRFRSACRLVGADEGARVRLYDENGLAIIFPDDFLGWIDGDPFHFVGYTVRLP